MKPQYEYPYFVISESTTACVYAFQIMTSTSLNDVNLLSQFFFTYKHSLFYSLFYNVNEHWIEQKYVRIYFKTRLLLNILCTQFAIKHVLVNIKQSILSRTLDYLWHPNFSLNVFKWSLGTCMCSRVRGSYSRVHINLRLVTNINSTFCKNKSKTCLHLQSKFDNLCITA